MQTTNPHSMSAGPCQHGNRRPRDIVPMVMSFIRLVERIGDPVYCGAGFVLVMGVGHLRQLSMVGTRLDC